jgi:hypothetical protein
MYNPTDRNVTAPARSYIIPEDELDSILIHQKDKIIKMIRNGKTEQALGAIKVLTELWYSLNYAYKADELIKQIKLPTR